MFYNNKKCSYFHDDDDTDICSWFTSAVNSGGTFIQYFARNSEAFTSFGIKCILMIIKHIRVHVSKGLTVIII